MSDIDQSSYSGDEVVPEIESSPIAVPDAGHEEHSEEFIVREVLYERCAVLEEELAFQRNCFKDMEERYTVVQHRLEALEAREHEVQAPKESEDPEQTPAGVPRSWMTSVVDRARTAVCSKITPMYDRAAQYKEKISPAKTWETVQDYKTRVSSLTQQYVREVQTVVESFYDAPATQTTALKDAIQDRIQHLVEESVATGRDLAIRVRESSAINTVHTAAQNVLASGLRRFGGASAGAGEVVVTQLPSTLPETSTAAEGTESLNRNMASLLNSYPIVKEYLRPFVEHVRSLGMEKWQVVLNERRQSALDSLASTKSHVHEISNRYVSEIGDLISGFKDAPATRAGEFRTKVDGLVRGAVDRCVGAGQELVHRTFPSIPSLLSTSDLSCGDVKSVPSSPEPLTRTSETVSTADLPTTLSRAEIYVGNIVATALNQGTVAMTHVPATVKDRALLWAEFLKAKVDQSELLDAPVVKRVQSVIESAANVPTVQKLVSHASLLRDHIAQQLTPPSI